MKNKFIIQFNRSVTKYCNKNPYEAKYQFLINKKESTWCYMDDVYKNIKECNPNEKRKILIVFVDIFCDFLSNEKLNSIVTELFIRGRKLNTSFVSVT